MEGEIWYRHGDVRRGEVFCALCDSFYHYPEGLPHFMAGEGYFGNHFANDFDKEAYSEDLALKIKHVSRKNRDDVTFKKGKYISDRDLNIFDGEKLVEDPFYRWLKKNWESIAGLNTFEWWALHDTILHPSFPKYHLTEESWKKCISGAPSYIDDNGEDVFLDEYLMDIYRKYKSKERRYIYPSLRFRILSRDKFACRLCGRDAGDGIKLEVDHKHPVSLGGENIEGNLWTLCFDCNRGKAAKTLDGIIKK